MGFSDAVIIFETKIKILLIHHYPFFKDIAHVLITPFPLSYVLVKFYKDITNALNDEKTNLTEHKTFWMTTDVQYLFHDEIDCVGYPHH